jgi:hypothetical protein
VRPLQVLHARSVGEGEEVSSALDRLRVAEDVAEVDEDVHIAAEQYECVLAPARQAKVVYPVEGLQRLPEGRAHQEG